ncbi:YceI family protein [Verrucomicrobium sp. 3C]|uniref:YceI family protein n=1 Tax=Verrucomicrobium sp. 3C TaxID=1134055 RepID=UPI000382E4D4|nr:YceI family protein [Verrucomicrobium sp. 3C]
MLRGTHSSMRFLPRACLLLWLALGTPSLLSAAVYQVDSARSKVEILVIRGGLLGFLSHDHEIISRKLTGTIDCSPSSLSSLAAEVSLPASSLTVVDPEVPPEERREVQSTMRGEQVLDVARYPEIHFTSTGTTPARDPAHVLVAGELSLHGIVKKIVFPVRLIPSSGAIRVAGTAKVRQSDFGIQPIRIAGGTMRIKDLVEIHFTVVAR